MKISALIISVVTLQGNHLAFSQQAPIPEKIKKEIVCNGHKRIDNYYWMNDSKKQNPKMLAHLKAENEYLKNMMKPTEELQEKLFKEMSGREEEINTSLPCKDNGYYYYTRYDKGHQYPIYARKKELENGEEEIILNANELAKNFKYFHVSNFGLSVSPDNKLLAFGYENTGSNGATLKFKNIKTGEWLKDEITNSAGDPVWANDNKTIFYSVLDDSYRSYKVKKHLLGENPKNDKVVFYEKDAAFDIFVYKSKSKKYIILRSFSAETLEYLTLNADDPSGNFKVFQPRQKGLEYSIDHNGDKFYVRTNYLAKNFRIMETPENKTGIENWKEIVPNKSGVYIFNMEIFNNYIALEEQKNGLTQINIIDLKNLTNHYIEFQEEVFIAYIATSHLSINFDFENEWLRYKYTSLTTPTFVCEYNMRTKEKKILKQTKITGGYNPSDYESKRIYAIAADNKKVPISLVYKKGLVLNGNNPSLIDGYGAYTSYGDVSFSSNIISLLDRGFVFAVAHIRGGIDLGVQWGEEGKLLNKKNTFTDFIACAEQLIKEGYTNPGKLFAQGGSMGGLLMGSVANMRPELFKGIISYVPFVDALTSMLEDNSEEEELGNPKKKEYYDYILSYSPYDNIEAKKYPALFLTTGIDDEYWPAAKYVAKLRELKTDDNPILLSTNMSAGHTGASGRFEALRERALEYAFLLQLIGIKE